MIVSSSVCVEHGAKIVAPISLPTGIAGFWTFDDVVRTAQIQTNKKTNKKTL
jgi:hypothetical protein